MRKLNVLFICTGNSARSQMAEALLRKHAGSRFDVDSAGLEPKGINPYTVRVLEEIDLDISSHRSKSIREFMGHAHHSYVITVCGDADEKCPQGLWSAGIKLHWPFDDPAAFEGTDEEKLAKFREIRDQIDRKVQSWVSEAAYADGVYIPTT